MSDERVRDLFYELLRCEPGDHDGQAQVLDAIGDELSIGRYPRP